jgi:uncharacterized membrane protein
MKTEKPKESLKKTIMLIPLIAAFAWMSSLIFNVERPLEGTEMMAPSAVNTLINVIFGFIIIYAVVLVFMFYRMNKKLSKKKHKKAKKKKK